MSAIVFGILRVAKLLRVDEETEDSGCDHECASPRAYNIKPQFAEGTVKAAGA